MMDKMECKNISAIEKIISYLSMRDYNAKLHSLSKAQRTDLKIGRKTLSDFGGYQLGADTKEAIEIRNNYVNRKINEEEYKAWCLRWNLANR